MKLIYTALLTMSFYASAESLITIQPGTQIQVSAGQSMTVSCQGNGSGNNGAYKIASCVAGCGSSWYGDNIGLLVKIILPNGQTQQTCTNVQSENRCLDMMEKINLAN